MRNTSSPGEEPVCRLCQRPRDVLSSEHLPPKSTGNEGPARIRYMRAATPSQAYSEADDGVALRVLCKECNSLYGSRLGTGFSDFARQVQTSGKVETIGGNVWVVAMEVFPARVIRSLLLNYLCLHTVREPPAGEVVRRYVRSRTAKLPAEAPRVALYFNVLSTYRIVPATAQTAIAWPGNPWLGAELAAPGLGVVFTLGDGLETSNLLDRLPVDVSAWGDYDFGAKRNITLELPRFRVAVPHPLAFGSAKEVDRWQTRRGVVWSVSTAGDETSVAHIAAVWTTGRGKRRRS